MLIPKADDRHRWTIWLLAVGFIGFLTVSFVLLLREGFRRAVVVPIIQAYLSVRFYSSRFPQFIIWSIPVFGMTVLLLTIYLRTVFTILQKEQAATSEKKEVDPLQTLAVMIFHARRRPFHRKMIVQKLKKTAIRIIAERTGLSLSEARERFESGDWCENRAVRNLFFNTRGNNRLSKVHDFKWILDKAISVLENLEQRE